MGNSDLLKSIPYFLQLKVRSLRKYTWAELLPSSTLNLILSRVDTQNEKDAEFKRLKGIVDEATSAGIIFLLLKTFQEGHEAAKMAVDTFQDLGVEGFSIGSQYFEGRNENVMRGEVLAQKLLDKISDEELVQLISDSDYLYEIINYYRRYV